MSIENKEFFVDDEYINSKNSSSFGKLVELSWDSPKYLTSLKGFFQLLETKYTSNCDFPPNPAKLEAHTLRFLRTEPNKPLDCENEQISASDVSPNLNISFFLLKSMDDIKGYIISLDLIKGMLPVLYESGNKTIISDYLAKFYNRDRLQFHPELLQRLKNLAPLEKDYISRAFCHSVLSKNLKNRDFNNFLLTNTFIFDIIDFDTGREFWSHVAVDLIEQDRDSVLNTLSSNNIDFYSYLPKFYNLLGESTAEFDELLTLIKNKDFNIFILLVFSLFINKIYLLR